MGTRVDVVGNSSQHVGNSPCFCIAWRRGKNDDGLQLSLLSCLWFLRLRADSDLLVKLVLAHGCFFQALGRVACGVRSCVRSSVFLAPIHGKHTTLPPLPSSFTFPVTRYRSNWTPPPLSSTHISPYHRCMSALRLLPDFVIYSV